MTHFAERRDTIISFDVIKTLSQLTYGPTTLSLTRFTAPLSASVRRLTLTSVFFHLATNHHPSKMIRIGALFLILALSTLYAEVVHFTPCPHQFGGDTLQSRAYWASEIVDLPFLGMPIEACPCTTCPAVPNQKQTYTVVLPISKKFPARTYDLKWKLWNEQEQECCFMFQIKLVK
ncbi:hypothetical protein EAG_12283 [Camponotus floridanus]|uniref:MD-2-related lipid-recognition domain-containing protein n=1 Tax=Camponotus floridanus TaxID=104421 RepID=E2AWK6_CAMFO|nr:hypothetical protein EAG_12283 [Camponotus floridanus]